MAVKTKICALLPLLILFHFPGIYGQFSTQQQERIDYLNQTIKDNPHDTLLVQAYVSLSEILYVNNIDTIIPLCAKAIEIAEKNLMDTSISQIEIKAYRRQLASALSNTGFARENQGEIPLALRFYHKSLKIQEDLDDKRGISYSLNNIGTVHYRQGDIPLALDYFHKSLNIQEIIGDKKGVANSLANLGAIYKRQGDTSNALFYFKQSLELAEQIGDKIGIGVTLNNIGILYRASGKLDPALKNYLRALQVHREIGDKRGVFYSLNNIGLIYLAQKNYNQAIRYGKESLTIAGEMGGVMEIRLASSLLYRAYKNAGMYSQSLDMHELFIQMKDSLINEENTRSLVEQEMNYIHEKEFEEENIQLAKEEHSRMLQQQKKSQLTLMGYGVVFILGISGFLFFRGYQRKKQVVHQQKVNDRLKHIDKLKDRFLANSSHELRTPLYGIIGLSQSLQRDLKDRGNDMMKHDLEMIISSGNRLSGLVNNILDFSKLKESSLVLSLQPVDLFEAVKSCFELLYPSIMGKQIELLNEIPEGLEAVKADPSRLHQILLNLVGNAIKFTEEGTVKVSAGTHEKMMTVSVEDTGIGIPKNRLESIFTAFSQVDASMDRQYEGSGLGLNISKKLIQLHGGELSVSSEEEIGSVFKFTLPISDQKAKKNTELKNPWQPKPIPGPVTEAIYDKNTAKGLYRILIVDDEPVNRQVLINYLKGGEFKLFQAGSGPEALKKIHKTRFDLVLLDVMMPGMSGFEVCRQIRQTYLSSELPVIMITAADQVEDLVQGLHTGANDYMIKPISYSELLARVNTHLNLLKINNAYGRFVPREFIRTLGKEDIIDVKLGDQAQENITVMFSDIRSYTQLSESMNIDQNFKFLNSYLGKIGPLIHKHDGFINQFLGDGIMALFQSEPKNAVLAAIAMHRKLDKYNPERISEGRNPISIGIGLHFGPLMLGIIGDEKRMGTGVVSNVVYIASKMENLTKKLGASTIISGETADRIPDLDNFHHRLLGKYQIQRLQDPVRAIEIFDGDSPLAIEKKETNKLSFESALTLFYSKNFTEAAVLFKQVLEIHPEDLAAKDYLGKCGEYMIHGILDDWAGEL